MIQTYDMLMEELNDYANPKTKIGRLVKEGKYTPIVRGLYEDDPSTPGYFLAGSIYGPSYLSFEFALFYYGLIPELVHTFTSATYDKKKKKIYETHFGRFTYRDVPKAVYPYGIKIVRESDYYFLIASPEKALCDMVYTVSPLKNQAEMMSYIEFDLRVDIDELAKFDKVLLRTIADNYRCVNVKLLSRIILKGENNG